MSEELEILRRKNDELYMQQLTACQTGIGNLETSFAAFRESLNTQLVAIQIQIAKLPAPISLSELEERFVTRREIDKESQLIDKLIETFITKDEIRPLKIGIYGMFLSIGGAVGLALLKFAFQWASKQ